MTIDLLRRKETHFVLWRPAYTDPPPALYIGSISTNPLRPYEQFQTVPLHRSPQFPELWEVAAQDCHLVEGQVYWYWFKVRDAFVYNNHHPVIYSTDPMAYTIDRRYMAPATPEQTNGNRLNAVIDAVKGIVLRILGGSDDAAPASVVLYQGGRLLACDPDGKTAQWEEDPPLDTLPPNNRLVFYELPTRWTVETSDTHGSIGTGTFRDVVSLIQKEIASVTFGDTVAALNHQNAVLKDLGINALELLPPADSGDRSNDDPYKWGYGTANYFAADYDLGHPGGADAPNASVDLANLIKVCHLHGIRFFLDAVMAFSRHNPYRHINFPDFYVQWKPKGAPDRDPEQGDRDGFGGDLFKYRYRVNGYDPISGEMREIVPARRYMIAHVAHWINYYRIDGLRLDSVNNTGSYDFLQEFKEESWRLWNQRGGKGDRFLVIGEELSVPMALITQRRLDGLWNERFKQIVRQVLVGRAASGDSFELSVRKLIDCRLLGFEDGTQAVNYLTSHDVGGYGNERICNYLRSNGIADIEKRLKLGFVCLLTAVGIPMILAGDEFADEHDLDIQNEHGSNKQVDAVNYNRLTDDWRQRVFRYTSRLVKFRTTSNALAMNDTRFIHVDFNDGKRVMVWQRGSGDQLVVVVANFSDYCTPDPFHPNARYVVPNFPATPSGKRWREITQERDVSPQSIGKESIFPWEAKVYALI